MIKTPILALDGFSAFAQDHNIHTHEISWTSTINKTTKHGKS